jgi:hypothetical protein
MCATRGCPRRGEYEFSTHREPRRILRLCRVCAKRRWNDRNDWIITPIYERGN